MSSATADRGRPRLARRWVRMTGPARALCYRLAVATGLRYSEISQHHARVVRLVRNPATVTVAAGYTKNGEPATLPLPATWLTTCPFVAELPPGEAGLPTAPTRERRCFALDLERAGIPYRDAGGLVFDFHALRCQCATLADRRWRVAPRRPEADEAFDPGADRPLHPPPRRGYRERRRIASLTSPRSRPPECIHSGRDGYGWRIHKQSLCPLFAHRRGRFGSESVACWRDDWF